VEDHKIIIIIDINFRPLVDTSAVLDVQGVKVKIVFQVLEVLL
jgi:hypothetical protein